MNRPPPISTLLPYPTLFRTRRLGLGPPRARGPAANPSPGPRRIRERGQCPERLGQGLRVSRGIFGKGDGTCRFSTPTERDRKSTRLNSSHGYISYAVFCLKKKNTQPSLLEQRIRPTPLMRFPAVDTPAV